MSKHTAPKSKLADDSGLKTETSVAKKGLIARFLSIVRRSKYLKLLFLILVVELVVIGYYAPYYLIKKNAKERIVQVSELTEKNISYGIVFGAGLNDDNTPSTMLRARLDGAIEAYNSKKVTAIIVSGDNRVLSYDEPTSMRRYLVAAGVPRENII
jgi:vancomycin permeability regulator SanA